MPWWPQHLSGWLSLVTSCLVTVAIVRVAWQAHNMDARVRQAMDDAAHRLDQFTGREPPALEATQWLAEVERAPDQEAMDAWDAEFQAHMKQKNAEALKAMPPLTLPEWTGAPSHTQKRPINYYIAGELAFTLDEGDPSWAQKTHDYIIQREAKREQHGP